MPEEFFRFGRRDDRKHSAKLVRKGRQGFGRCSHEGLYAFPVFQHGGELLGVQIEADFRVDQIGAGAQAIMHRLVKSRSLVLFYEMGHQNTEDRIEVFAVPGGVIMYVLWSFQKYLALRSKLPVRCGAKKRFLFL